MALNPISDLLQGIKRLYVGLQGVKSDGVTMEKIKTNDAGAMKVSAELTGSLPPGDNLIGAVMNHGDIPNYLFDTPNDIGVPLLANETYTQDVIDRPHPNEGEIPQGQWRGWVFADQAGTLYLEESNVATSGFTTTSTKVVAAGVSAIVPWTELQKKYARYRYVNGNTNQGVFILIQYYKGVDKTPVMSNDGDFVTLGTKNDTAVIDPAASSTVTAGLKGILKQLQGDGTAGKSAPVQLAGSIICKETNKVVAVATDILTDYTATQNMNSTLMVLTNVAGILSLEVDAVLGSMNEGVSLDSGKWYAFDVPITNTSVYNLQFSAIATMQIKWIGGV